MLKRARALRDNSGLVFPSPTRPGQPMSDMTLTKLLRDHGLADKTVVHGFRSCFRTWAGERTNMPTPVIELCLAHAVGNAVEQAYARSDLLQKRQRLMQAWGRYVTGEGRADVVPLHG